jgi:peptidoglycan/LPS O-acetylase OafA/YrhL
LARALTQPVLTTFGRYSYTLYVVHLPIAYLLIARFTEQNRWPLAGGSDLPARLAFAFVGVSMSLIIAWLSWYLLEQPLLRLKARVPYRRRDDDAGAPALEAVRTAAGQG